MENKIKFKPLGDRILVKPEEEKNELEKTKGGIILPDAVQQGVKKLQGEVVSIGTGIFSQNGVPIPITVSPGDTVLYYKGGGEKLPLGDTEYLMFKEHELIGILTHGE